MVVKRVHTYVHKDRDEFLAEVAKAYYERGLTQAEVAEQFGVSRSQISRYLDAARSRGIVQIRVTPTGSRAADMEEALRESFPHLRTVRVASALTTDEAVLRRLVGNSAARLLEQLVVSGTTVCFGAGRTLAETVNQIESMSLSGVRVVQAMGNAGHEATSIDYNSIAQTAAAAFGGSAHQINAPAILGVGSVAAELEESNRQIGRSLDLARDADIYVLGIGSLSSDQLYVKTGLMRLSDFRTLAAGGAVGDICGNFYNIDGQACDSPFEDRLVGIRLEHLRRARTAIACLAGKDKIDGLTGALRGRLVNGLVTDEHTARGVLEATSRVERG